MNISDYVELRDGVVVWKISPRYGVNIGAPVGCLRRDGYSVVKIRQKSYLVHRLAVFLRGGVWPVVVDHIDRNKQNNHVDNLRPCSVIQNSVNRHRHGVRGREDGNSFEAYMSVGGKYFHIGSYSTHDEAKQQRDRVAKEWYGEFY
jgi:hypothetical protein